MSGIENSPYQKDDKLFVRFVKSEKTMKAQAARNRSGKRPPASPDVGANAAASGKKSVQAAKARHAAAKPQTGRATPVEAPPRRVAHHRRESVKREKVVRDTFTMPREDYEQLAVLKQRCLDAGFAVKKKRARACRAASAGV
ncbi:hypothetical protein [Paraburkholderia oxyphila]|uniref:hypothetical protein n=1 Tax=Paraburkholderia oxyphila TaxID=614212 RepID=UPI001FDFEBB4|nr:hypothetical protein [Paraburkholderia oxyphila]